MLMNSDEISQNDAKKNILEGLTELTKFIDHDGPFFLGKEFGYADIVLVPWMQRILSVSKVYRNFEIPNEFPLTKFHTWYNSCLQIPAFKKTIVNQEKLVANYSGYANNSATSTVAKQFRSN